MIEFKKAKEYKIAEAYIRLKMDYSVKNQKMIKSTLKKIVIKEIYDFKYKDNITYVIIVEQGSIKAKVLIYGTIIIQGISNYGSIREGMGYLYEDVKNISERVIEIAKQENNQINEQTIERTERRTGLIGRLKRTTDRIEYLQNNLNDLGNNQIQNELNNLKQDLSNILELLDEQERQTILQRLPRETRNRLPNPIQKEVEHLYKLYALKPEEIELEDEQ